MRVVGMNEDAMYFNGIAWDILREGFRKAEDKGLLSYSGNSN